MIPGIAAVKHQRIFGKKKSREISLATPISDVFPLISATIAIFAPICNILSFVPKQGRCYFGRCVNGQHFSIQCFLHNWLSLCFGASNFCSSVVIIVLVCTPFQIVGTVVQFILVFVIDTRQTKWIWNKRFRHKTVNLLFYSLFFRVKCNNSISRIYQRRLQNKFFWLPHF